MPKKTKTNYSAATMPEKDRCQTPSYALDPILPYLNDVKYIWEPAAGEMLLAFALDNKTKAERIVSSDILWGSEHDFFQQDALAYWFPEDSYAGKRAIVTNPPFSLKYKWLERCYELGYPFALLMPSDTLFAASANKLFQKYGVEGIIMNPRVDFKMPNKGWQGKGSIFATAWFTWKLNIGQMITFADISEGKKAFKKELENE